MKQMNPVGWFDLHVANLDRAKAFYEAVFDIQLTDLPSEWGRQSFFPFHPGQPFTSGALVERPDMTPGNSTVVYFESADCTTEEKRIEQAGGNVVQPKTAIGEFGYISLFTDSEGNLVGLHSRR